MVHFKVVPRASKSRLGDILGDMIKLYIKAPPVDNKANAEIIDFLSEMTGLKRNDISIIRGKTSQKKKVFLKMNKTEFEKSWKGS